MSRRKKGQQNKGNKEQTDTTLNTSSAMCFALIKKNHSPF
jgi:hypothetical protein